MADTKSERQRSWADGVSKISEAARLNLTATNLAYAGTVAIAAGAAAYFWDRQRRDDFRELTRRWTSQWIHRADETPEDLSSAV